METTGSATFLMTDMEGSTRLWDESPQLASEVAERQERLIGHFVARAEGRVIKERGEGDSLFCVFARPTDAVRAAVDIQLALAREEWPDGAAPSVRIAIHTGEVEERDDDFYGPAVNRCARIRGIAHGGQILLSQAVERVLRESPAFQGRLMELGSHRLRDLSRPEVLFQVVHPELPAEFPPLRSLDSQPNNLPVQLTSFIGRKDEVSQGIRLLRGARLLSLVGPGGSGKTRLSLQIAAESQELFPDGVWYADLVPIGKPEHVAERVASELRAKPPSSGGPESALLDRLREARSLLVLDNCEHVISGAISLCRALLKGCPNLTILATSRQALGLSGEQLCPVPPMGLPSSERGLAAKLAASDSGRLFEERARAVDPSFSIHAKNAVAVACICRAIDGIPLAIELAAARLKALSPEQILERLSDRFALLTDAGQEGDRHKTLHAAIDWSYGLLDEQEKRLFESLAVFQGGWTLEAAEEVCKEAVGKGRTVLDLLQELIDRSVVVAELPGSGGARYRMLESIRQFALERFELRKDKAKLRQEHFDYFLRFAERARPNLTGKEQKLWLDRIDADLDNIRTALRWSLEQKHGAEPALRVVTGLAQFWVVKGHFSEVAGIIRTVLNRGQKFSDLKLSGDALNLLGVLSMLQGDLDAALRHLEESRLIRENTGDLSGLAATLNNIGMIHREREDLAKASEAFEQGVESLRQGTSPIPLAYALLNLGCTWSEIGEFERATVILEESLTVLRDLNDQAGICYAAANLGYVGLKSGGCSRCPSLFSEALTAGQATGCQMGLYEALSGVAEYFLSQGRHDGTALAMSAADRVLREVDSQPTPLKRHGMELLTTKLKECVGEDGLARLQSTYGELPPEQAISATLSMLS